MNRYASDDDVSDYLSTSDRYASEGGGSSRSGIHSDEDGW